MRLAILGGGGFRTPLVYEAVANEVTGMRVDEVVLYDVDPVRLRVIERITTEMAAARGEGATSVRSTNDLACAVRGADFVFAAIRVGGTQSRTVDERVALELGLLGQETVGPGGLAYALRTIPVMRHVAEVIRKEAPDAWVINFTNPAGIVTEAMQQILGPRVVGICDTPIGLVRRVARAFGRTIADVDYDYVGLNHLGWLRRVSIDGQDRLPALLADDALIQGIEEARIVGIDYVRQMGCLPNEYFYYYLHTDDAIRRIREAGETRGEFLQHQQHDFYEAASDECCDSPLTLWRNALHTREATYMSEGRDEERREEDIAGGGYQEVALRLMTAIATDQPERMILNVANGSGPEGPVVAQLPEDLTIEVGCVVDGKGIHAQAVAAPSLEHLGRMARLRGAERCILTAAVEGDASAAWEGFSTHPLVDSPVLGAKLLDGYRARSKDIATVLG